MAAGTVVEKVLGNQFQEMHISTNKMLSELESADKNLVLRQTLPENIKGKGGNLAFSRIATRIERKTGIKLPLQGIFYHYP